MNKIGKKLRDPVSSLSHFAGALCAVPVTAALVIISGTWLYALAFAVFGAAMFLLYMSSGVYHAVRNIPLAKIWRKVDHMMIFVLIAGTYTPVCLIVLPFAWGIGLLIAIWAIALFGILMTGVWLKAPAWLNAVIYVLMGWVCAFAFVPLIAALPEGGLVPLVAGGVAYTVGSVLYAVGGYKNRKLKKESGPNYIPFNPAFGWHEVFHLFTLAGSGLHILFMFRYVLPI